MTGKKPSNVVAQNNHHLLVGQNVGWAQQGCFVSAPHGIAWGNIFMTRASTGIAESLTMKWRLVQACLQGSSILRG